MLEVFILQFFFRKGSDGMKFLCYSLFGWGMPLLLAILTHLFDIFPHWGNIRPQMGQNTCFLSISGSRFFFYMPIMILLCSNTIMYLVTVYRWELSACHKKIGSVHTKSRSIYAFTTISLANHYHNISGKGFIQTDC